MQFEYSNKIMLFQQTMIRDNTQKITITYIDWYKWAAKSKSTIEGENKFEIYKLMILIFLYIGNKEVLFNFVEYFGT